MAFLLSLISFGLAFAQPPTLIQEFNAIGFTEEGQSTFLEFDLPPGFESFLITIQGHSRIQYLVDHLESPTGEKLIHDQGEDSVIVDQRNIRRECPRFGPLRPSSSNRGSASFLMHNQTTTELPSGEWRFRIHTTKFYIRKVDEIYPQVNEPVRIQIVGKKRVVSESPISLKLNFYFHRNQSWNAASVASDRAFQEMLVEMQKVFQLARIRLVPTSFADMGKAADDVDVFNVENLFTQTDPHEGMNILIAQESGALGFSAGIPGPVLLPGSMASGVALFRSSKDSPRIWAWVLSHEIGHYLGLFHSGSASSDVGDHLSDTDPSDITNLMFSHRHPKVEMVTLTPDQIQVLRSHPCVYFLE